MFIAIVLVACTSVPKSPDSKAAACDCPTPPPVAAPAAKPSISWANALEAVPWDDLKGWNDDRPSEAWDAFQRSCEVLRSRPGWENVCAASATIDGNDDAAVRAFFVSNFVPHAVRNSDGAREGQITGYYEPFLNASRVATEIHRFPVYGVPDDLLVVDLSSLYPELKGLRLRGRVEGTRVVPYWSRAEIEAGRPQLREKVLLWVEDPVDLFFLQIQGSGKVTLDTGEVVRLSYADQNGHPYRSIGRLLVERGELTADQASMQGIKEWGTGNPERLPALLNENASFVFFSEGPATAAGPTGALGVTLTPERSIAVDPRAVPLGAPVFLATTVPASMQLLRRLTLAQDTGGAIKGAVRADFFWGSGPEAGALAGRMRQSGRLWVLLPVGFRLDTQN